MVDFLLTHARALLQNLVIFGLLALALRRGDMPEKLSAMVLPVMVLLSYSYQLLFAQWEQFETVRIGDMIIDALALIAFAAIALRANRIYPLWLLGAQLVSMTMHFTRDISVTMHPMAYFILTRAPSYIQIVALAMGLYCHRRRLARYGNYRPWRAS